MAIHPLDRVYCPYCLKPVARKSSHCKRCDYDFIEPKTIREMLAGMETDRDYNDVDLGGWTRLIRDLLEKEV